jgi:hypothetical protein
VRLPDVSRKKTMPVLGEDFGVRRLLAETFPSTPQLAGGRRKPEDRKPRTAEPIMGNRLSQIKQ